MIWFFTVLNTPVATKDCRRKSDITNWICIYSLIHQNPDLLNSNNINFKPIHEFNLTPIIIHKFCKDNAPNCLRCKTKEGTFIHVFWHLLKGFCRSVNLFTTATLKTELRDWNWKCVHHKPWFQNSYWHCILNQFL